MKYKRILLKLSGEALAGDLKYGISSKILKDFCTEIKFLYEKNIEIAIVIGGGNIHRSVSQGLRNIDRSTSDHMGMLATVINALALQDQLENLKIQTRVLSAIEMKKIAEPYIRRRAVRHLEKKRIIIFAAGTGNPYFTTDTAAALRANEIDSPILLKATKVDGVYDKDPLIYKDAQIYHHLTYLDVLKKELKVMDSTAISLCKDNHIEIRIFNIFTKGNLKKILLEDDLGTTIDWRKDER